MSEQNTPNSDASQQIDYCYEVLTPIKFRGQIVKPQAFVQLSDAEAAPLIAKGYISAEQALPPSAEQCEGGAPDCGAVEFHDSEGVPLCRRCADELASSDAATQDATEVQASEDLTGGDQLDQVAAGGADAAAGTTELTSEATTAEVAHTDGAESTTDVPQGAPAGGESPAGGTVAVLVGSDKFEAVVEIGGEQIQLGTLVQAAYVHSQAADADAWNALPQEDRDGFIQAAIDARTAAVSAGADGRQPGRKGRSRG